MMVLWRAASVRLYPFNLSVEALPVGWGEEDTRPLGELVTARLGAGAVSLAVGGSTGRTKKDIAIEARELIPVLCSRILASLPKPPLLYPQAHAKLSGGNA